MSFIGSIITAIFSVKSSKRSNEVSTKLGEINASTLDKQRIIETVGVRRIEWINEVRNQFVEYNTHLNMIRYLIENDETDQGVEKNTELLNKIISTMFNLRLFLNYNEKYAKVCLRTMDSLKLRVLKVDIDKITFENEMRFLTFTQIVILKAEWNRIKMETELGRSLETDEMNTIFEKVGEKLDRTKHQLVIEQSVLIIE